LAGWSVFQVRYLGNVLTAFVKGVGCVDRPMLILWNNYNTSSASGICLYIQSCAYAYGSIAPYFGSKKVPTRYSEGLLLQKIGFGLGLGIELQLWGVYTIQQTYSKLPANVFKIGGLHVLMLNVCWIM